jgi:hypothetical protein
MGDMRGFLVSVSEYLGVSSGRLTFSFLSTGFNLFRFLDVAVILDCGPDSRVYLASLWEVVRREDAGGSVCVVRLVVAHKIKIVHISKADGLLVQSKAIAFLLFFCTWTDMKKVGWLDVWCPIER